MENKQIKNINFRRTAYTFGREYYEMDFGQSDLDELNNYIKEHLVSQEDIKLTFKDVIACFESDFKDVDCQLLKDDNSDKLTWSINGHELHYTYECALKSFVYDWINESLWEYMYDSESDIDSTDECASLEYEEEEEEE